MKKHTPPKFPLKIFRYYCSEERLEELEGDLFEVFQERISERGTRFSHIFYWWLVIKSFRSYALKRTKTKDDKMSRSFTILKHNLLIAWRNLLKNRVTAMINIVGLSIGLGTFLSIFSIIQYELSFNEGIPNKERIYRIYTTYSGSFSSTNKGVGIPIGPYVEETFIGLDEVAYFQTFTSSIKIPEAEGSVKEFERQTNILIATPSYFNLIDQYNWLVGSPESALEDPFKVVLTTDQAEKYFGKTDWSELIGREIIYQDSLNVFVSGIIEKPNYNTDFIFTEFISHATIDESWLNERFGNIDWGSTSSGSQLWVKLNSNTTEMNIVQQLEGLDEHVEKNRESHYWVQNYLLQPLSDVHFNSEIGTFDHGRKAAHGQTLTILGVVAVTILLIAIFNFINLETAQSTTKSKEVGVRKVLGSPRKQLVGRFLTESTMISFFAIILSIPIAHYAFVFFEEFVPSGVKLPYDDPAFWLTIMLLVVIVGISAGIYPSWVISSFKPINILKSGTKVLGQGRGLVRRVLILFQFFFSQLLIVATIAIGWQISFMLDKELGIDEEAVLFFYTPYYESIDKQKIILNELDVIPEISNYAIQNTPPIQRGYSTSTVKYDTPQGEAIADAHHKSGDTTYLGFYGIELLAGRNLTPIDSAAELLINETFMSDLGFTDPREALGASIHFNEKDHKVIGIMKDFHFRSLHHPIQPMFYRFQDNTRCISLKVNNQEHVQKVIDQLTDKWSEVYSENPLTIYFMDEVTQQFYETEKRASKLASTATGIAILISCLGMFGLISFTIIQKSKELGIRKVLGASLTQIGVILSREFVALIVMALVVSVPISYYIIGRWMEDFAYQTKIHWWIYLLGGLISILIALISIGTKIWKASEANPIDSLRYE